MQSAAAASSEGETKRPSHYNDRDVLASSLFGLSSKEFCCWAKLQQLQQQPVFLSVRSYVRAGSTFAGQLFCSLANKI